MQILLGSSDKTALINASRRFCKMVAARAWPARVGAQERFLAEVFRPIDTFRNLWEQTADDGTAMSRIALVLAPGALAEANGEVEALAGKIHPIVVGLYAQVEERTCDALAFDDAVSMLNAENESAAKRVSFGAEREADTTQKICRPATRNKKYNQTKIIIKRSHVAAPETRELASHSHVLHE